MSSGKKGSEKDEFTEKDKSTVRQQSPFDLTEIRASDDISLSELFDQLWIGRMKIMICILFFLFLGFFHYTFAPTEFKSESKLLMESDSRTGISGLQALGQIGGFNFRSGASQSGMISPELYPDIIENVEFQRELLYQPIYFEKYGKELTLFEYFNDYYTSSFREKVYRGVIDYTVKLPFTLYGLMRRLFQSQNESNLGLQEDILDKEVFILRPEFRYAMNMMKERITLNSDGELIEVETELPDPMASATVNVIVSDKIRDYVISYRSEKARQNLQFVEELYETAKENHEAAQYQLALFTDRNLGNLTATAEIEREKLEDEKNLRYQIYSSISERLEEAKVRLQEDTPIFTTFQRPILPTSKESSTLLIFPFTLIVGFVFGIIWIISGKYYPKVVEHVRSLDRKN